MKNRVFIFISALLLVSCWNDKNKSQQNSDAGSTEVQQPVENVQFANGRYNKAKKILDGEYPKYTINIDVKYAVGNKQVAEIINKQLADFLFGNSILPFEYAMKQFGDSLASGFEKELKEFYDKDDENKETYAYEYTQTGKISKDSPEGIIAYTNRIETYTGGAHGDASENQINLNAETGSIITSDEIFGKNKEAVAKLIKEQIVKDNNCKTAAELEEKRSIFSLGDVYISDNNFLLQKDGILFCYNPYEIAPWSEGFIYTKLTYKQLEGFISPNCIKTK